MALVGLGCSPMSAWASVAATVSAMWCWPGRRLKPLVLPTTCSNARRACWARAALAGGREEKSELKGIEAWGRCGRGGLNIQAAGDNRPLAAAQPPLLCKECGPIHPPGEFNMSNQSTIVATGKQPRLHAANL